MPRYPKQYTTHPDISLLECTQSTNLWRWWQQCTEQSFHARNRSGSEGFPYRVGMGRKLFAFRSAIWITHVQATHKKGRLRNICILYIGLSREGRTRRRRSLLGITSVRLRQAAIFSAFFLQKFVNGVENVLSCGNGSEHRRTDCLLVCSGGVQEGFFERSFGTGWWLVRDRTHNIDEMIPLNVTCDLSLVCIVDSQRSLLMFHDQWVDLECKSSINSMITMREKHRRFR